MVQSMDKNPSNEIAAVDASSQMELMPSCPPITEIKSLDDLILVAESLDSYTTITTESKKRLQQVLPCLKKLRGMIGLTKIKNQIVHQVVFYIQKLNDGRNDMMHTCIEGDPGCGKTSLAKIIGEIYCSLGVLSSSKFNIVKRSDLVAGYLGQTAIKTQKVLDDAKGGVLFIDEAYSLGNQEEKDFFSKECIDTINRFLTENKDDFVCIIAGYRDSLRSCFFSVNPGLERRFPWRYCIDPYTPQEVYDIFRHQVKINGYLLQDQSVSADFFKQNAAAFRCAGGDTETFLGKCKIYHASRVLFLPRRFKKLLDRSDIENGFRVFKDAQSHRNENNQLTMYM